MLLARQALRALGKRATSAPIAFAVARFASSEAVATSPSENVFTKWTDPVPRTHDYSSILPAPSTQVGVALEPGLAAASVSRVRLRGFRLGEKPSPLCS